MVESHLSWAGLLMLGVVGVVVIGGIVAMVALLANPKTRAAGVVLTTIGLLVVVVGGLLIGAWAVSYRSRAVHVRQRAVAVRPQVVHQRQLSELERHRIEAGDRSRIILDAPAPAPATQASETPTPSDATTEAGAATGAEEEPAGEASAGTEEPVEETSAGGNADEPDEETSAGADTATEGAPPPPAEPADAADTATDTPAEAEDTSATEERPEWVDKLPEVTADVYQVRIKTDPLPHLAECESQLPDFVDKAVIAYAESQLGRSSQVARRVQLTPQYIEENIVQQKWPEPVEISLGKWVQLHALLEFDKEAKGLIEKQCEQHQQRLDEQRAESAVFRRLCYSGTGLVAVLTLLAMLFACLKVDHATAGACRGRLCLAASAAIAIVAAAAWCAVMFVQEPAIVGEVVAPIESAVYQTAAAEGSQEAVVEVARDTARLKLLVVGGVAVGGILALLAVVGLLANSKTRGAGLAVLAVLVLGLLLPLGMHFGRSIGPVELLVVVGASVYVILLTVLSRHQWAWILGMIACFVVAALFTPADPLSMLLVVVPLCVLYTVAVLAWKAPRREAGGEIPPRERVDAPAGQP